MKFQADVFPNQPQICLYYAPAAIALGHYDDALNQLDQALPMAGKNANLIADILDLSGNALIGKGDTAKAKKMWEKAFDINKNPAIQEKINRVQ